MKNWFVFLFVCAFLLLLAHGIFTYANSYKCSNLYNRSCTAQYWRVWQW